MQFSKSLGDKQGEISATKELKQLEIDSMSVSDKLGILEDKASDLSNRLQSAKLNPENTVEAQQLKQQLELATSKLDNSKNKARELQQELNFSNSPIKTLNDKFNETNSKLQKIISKISSVFSGGKGFNSFGKKLDAINKKISRFGRRITSLIASALIFNVLSSGLRKLSDGLAGALKSNDQFSSSLNQIKVNLLTAFAPIYSAILPAINTLMSALSSITGQIASFVSSVFGKSTAESKNNAKAIYSQSKAYNELGKSAKKANNSLSSLDEIESINSDDGSDSTGGSSGGAGDLDFSGAVQESGKLYDYLNKIKDLIAKDDFFGVGETIAHSINNALKSINVIAFTDKVHDILQGTVQIFNGFVTGLDWSLLGTKFSELTVGLTGAISDAIKAVEWKELGKGISEFIKSIKWDELTENTVSIFTNAIVGISQLINGIDWTVVGKTFSTIIKTALSTITKAIKEIDWGELGKNIGKFLMSIDWIGIAVEILKLLVQGLGGAKDLLIGFVKGIIEGILNINWGEVAGKIVQLLLTGLQLLFENTIGIFTRIFGAILSIDWGQVGSGIFSLITNALSGIAGWFGDVFLTAFDAVCNAFSTVGTFFTETVWGSIKNAFSHVTEWFRTVFSTAWNAVKNVFSTGGKIFDGIKDGIVSAFKTVVNGIIGGINKVVAVPFNAINGVLGKVKNISIAGIKPFKGLIHTISVPQIPKLAKGAVIPPNAEFLATLGDQKHGNNLEAPESLIRQIVREESGGMNTDLLIELNKNLLELSKRPIALDVNGKELAQAIYGDLKNEEIRVGSNTAIRRY